MADTQRWVVLGNNSRMQCRVYGVWRSEAAAERAIKAAERDYPHSDFDFIALPLREDVSVGK